MATTFDAYYRTVLTGGTAEALDAISVSSLSGGEVAWVKVGTTLYQYYFDDTATDEEATPTYIRPDDYVDEGVWKLISLYHGVLPTMPTGVEVQGGVSGLSLTQNSSDADHDIDISIGACKDSTNAADIILSSALTKRLDADWTVGTGNGAMRSSGSLPASGYINIWAITNGTTTDVMATQSGDTMNTSNLDTWASGYTHFRWLGYLPTDSSSNICDFIMVDDHLSFNLASESVISSNITTSFATVTHSTYMPESRIRSIEYGSRDASASGYIVASDDGTNVSFIVGSAASLVADTSNQVWGAQADQKGSLKPFYASREFKASTGTLDLLVKSVIVRR